MNINSSIYFVGSLFKGSTAVHRLNAIKTIYSNVHSIDQQIINNKTSLLFDRLLNKLSHFTINSKILNKKILNEVNTNNPKVIWIDKGLFIYPETLKKIYSLYPGIKIIHYSPDDMMNQANQTRYYLSSISLYDLHVTTKSYNVDELYNIGAKKVLFVINAYAPDVHKPFKLTQEEMEKYSADVSFIGGPEKERADSINFLAEMGLKVTIWSNGWEKLLVKNKNITLKKGWFANEEYCKIICASKINLAFLRKINRDLQTTRTMEIPACGGFMLAERTNEHLALFKEDEEAVFFSDNGELKRKIEYYLNNEDERIKIAMNGYRKCISAGYDNFTMVKKVIGSF